MRMTVYLSDNVADVLRCYGSINDVVNKILIAGADGLIDVMSKPTISERKGGHYYQLEVKEPNYLELVDVYGTKSSKISIRRLLYWFVDNEIYEELGWEPVGGYVASDVNKGYDTLMDIKQLLYKASKLLPEYSEDFTVMRNKINEIEEKVWDV